QTIPVSLQPLQQHLSVCPDRKVSASQPFSSTAVCWLKFTRRAASIRSSHTRATKFILLLRVPVNTSVVNIDRRLDQQIFCSPPRAVCIALRTSRATSRCGFCSTARRAASRLKHQESKTMAEFHSAAPCFPVADI